LQDLGIDLTEFAGHLHEQGMVTQIMPDLAFDVARCDGFEAGHPRSVRIVVFDRLEQPDGADLHEVFYQIGSETTVPLGNLIDKRHMLIDERVPFLRAPASNGQVSLDHFIPAPASSPVYPPNPGCS